MGNYSILLGFLVVLFAASLCQADDNKAAGVVDLDTFDHHFLHHIYKKHPLFKKPEPPVHKPEPKEPEKPMPSVPKKQEKKKSNPEKKKSKPQEPKKKEEPKKQKPSIKKKPCPVFHGIPKIPKKFGFPGIPKIPLPPHAA